MSNSVQHSSKAVRFELSAGSFSSVSTVISALDQRQITFDDFEANEEDLPLLCESPESIGCDSRVVTPEEEIDILLLDNRAVEGTPSKITERFQSSRIRRNGKVSYSTDPPFSDSRSKDKAAEDGSLQDRTRAPSVESIDLQFPIQCTGGCPGEHVSHRSVYSDVVRPACLSTAVLGFCLIHVNPPTAKTCAYKPKALSRRPYLRKLSLPALNRDIAIREGPNPTYVEGNASDVDRNTSFQDLIDNVGRSMDDVPSAGPSRLTLDLPVPITKRLIRDGTDWVKMLKGNGGWNVQNGERPPVKAKL